MSCYPVLCQYLIPTISCEIVNYIQPLFIIDTDTEFIIECGKPEKKFNIVKGAYTITSIYPNFLGGSRVMHIIHDITSDTSIYPLELLRKNYLTINSYTNLIVRLKYGTRIMYRHNIRQKPIILQFARDSLCIITNEDFELNLIRSKIEKFMVKQRVDEIKSHWIGEFPNVDIIPRNDSCIVLTNLDKNKILAHFWGCDLPEDFPDVVNMMGLGEEDAVLIYPPENFNRACWMRNKDATYKIKEFNLLCEKHNNIADEGERVYLRRTPEALCLVDKIFREACENSAILDLVLIKSGIKFEMKPKE